MTGDGDTVLVCMRVADVAVPVTGARQVECDLCGEAVWFSPSAPKHDKALCMQCAEDTVAPDAKFEPITEKQVAEVKEYFAKKRH